MEVVLATLMLAGFVVLVIVLALSSVVVLVAREAAKSFATPSSTTKARELTPLLPPEELAGPAPLPRAELEDELGAAAKRVGALYDARYRAQAGGAVSVQPPELVRSSCGFCKRVRTRLRSLWARTS